MNITLEQAIEALESNESDAMNGRIDFATFKERGYLLESQFRSLLTQKAIQRAHNAAWDALRAAEKEQA